MIVYKIMLILLSVIKIFNAVAEARDGYNDSNAIVDTIVILFWVYVGLGAVYFV